MGKWLGVFGKSEPEESSIITEEKIATLQRLEAGYRDYLEQIVFDSVMAGERFIFIQADKMKTSWSTRSMELFSSYGSDMNFVDALVALCNKRQEMIESLQLVNPPTYFDCRTRNETSALITIRADSKTRKEFLRAAP